MNGGHNLDTFAGTMVSTRSTVFTQHETVGEDGVPVTIGASGSGVANGVDDVESAVVVGAGRGRRAGGSRGRGRGPVLPQPMMIGETQVQQLLGGLHSPMILVRSRRFLPCMEVRDLMD